MSQHILLTSLGMRAIPTTYQWDGKTATAPLTPLALLQFFDSLQQPNRVVAMVTDGARHETWPVFEAEICNNLEIKPEAVDIPDGTSSDEIGEILEKVAKKIPEGAELTLDVTQGFRHFPFIFYALVLYLTSLRGVKIRGAYYGMIEGFDQKDPTPRPIIDLQPLLELPEWFHAVRMFRDQGTTEPIAQLLGPLADMLKNQTGQLFKAGDKEAGLQRSSQAKQVSGAISGLNDYAFAYESALPLELGKASAGLIDSINQFAGIDFDGLPPLAEELSEGIVAAAKEVAFKKAPGGGSWKNTIDLNQDELDRQAGMIDLYLERGQLSLAIGLMREWVVSWAMMKSDHTVNWVDRRERQPYERRLGALGKFAGDSAFKNIVTANQKEFGTFWNQLADSLRNVLHHHAMRDDLFEKPPTSLSSVKEFWGKLKKGAVDLPQLGGSKGKLLLSPQGTRPGVLFSALQVAKPDACVVICSASSTSGIDEAAKQADFDVNNIEQIILSDPHGGFSEIEKIKKQVRRLMLEADEVRANLTGGTTLMGVIVQRLTEEAQKLDRPVRRFALIDRRDPAEQDSDPFVQSEHYWLDRKRT